MEPLTKPSKGAPASTPADLRGLAGLSELLPQAPFSTSDIASLPRRLGRELGVPGRDRVPDVQVDDTWTRDGIDGTALRWHVGFGAETEAWLLRPAGERAPLPGVLALHCHGGMKRYGKEKIADGPGLTPSSIEAFRDECYSSRALANEIAHAGHAVLVHDVFGWGSRRALVTDMAWRGEHVAELELDELRRRGVSVDDAREYDIHAGAHEDVIAKTLGVLGTSWGGVVAREDLIATDVLTSRTDVAPGGITFVGMSGGGARAAMANALSPHARGAAIVSMMSTFRAVLDGYLHSHTWMMMNPGIGRVGEWPDIAASRAPRPLFVGFAERDALFPLAGMRDADAVIRHRYADAGAQEAYTSRWHDTHHSFDVSMQRDFLAWHRDLL